jgi:hypothetical protein
MDKRYFGEFIYLLSGNGENTETLLEKRVREIRKCTSIYFTKIFLNDREKRQYLEFVLNNAYFYTNKNVII